MIPIRSILGRASVAEPSPVPARTAANEALFAQLLVAHTDTCVDRDLLEYAAFLASLQTDVSVHVIAAPTDGVLRTLGPAIRGIFAARGVLDVSPWVLPEADLDEVFAMIRNVDADLLVLRHPRAFPNGRALARRLLAEAPCSVCYIPDGAPRRLDRVVAGINLEDEGSQLIEYAARLCHKARAEELLAVHACFRETLAWDESADEHFRQETLLAIYHHFAGAKLNGALIEPVVEESACYSQAILNVARERMADAIVVGRSGISGAPLLSRNREAEDLLWHCEVPLFQVLLSRDRISLGRVLRERLLSQPEPTFN